MKHVRQAFIFMHLVYCSKDQYVTLWDWVNRDVKSNKQTCCFGTKIFLGDPAMSVAS
jgi:hypothetical protein